MVRNPRIDSVSENFPEIQVNFKTNINDGYFLQILNYSYQIIEPLMNRANKVLLSNVLYLKILDPKNSEKIEIESLGSSQFSIEFQLLSLPAYKNIDDKILCLSFELDFNINTKFGKVSKINESLLRVKCLYSQIKNFHNVYFSVGIDN